MKAPGMELVTAASAWVKTHSCTELAIGLSDAAACLLSPAELSVVGLRGLLAWQSPPFRSAGLPGACSACTAGRGPLEGALPRSSRCFSAMDSATSRASSEGSCAGSGGACDMSPALLILGSPEFGNPRPRNVPKNTCIPCIWCQSHRMAILLS